MHTLEVTKELAVLIYGIQKGLKINVGRWINYNISHTVRKDSGDIPLITSHGIDTTGHEVLQPKGSLNLKAIERIVTLELRQEATGASSSGARAPRPAHPTQTRATISDLAQAVERQEAQVEGMQH